jgi:hypothetical protein
MAAIGQIESFFGGLPAELKKQLVAFARYTFKSLRFGAPPEDTGAAASENFAGSLVRFTTSAVANAENAVAHRRDQTPRSLLPLLALDTVGATVPVLTVTRAADATYVYVSSPSTSTECLTYVE